MFYFAGAQKLASISEIETEGLKLSFKEHYSFMDTSEPDSPSTQADPSSQPEEVQEVLHPQRKPLTKGEHYYLKNTLSKLNNSLAPLKAHANIEESKLECVVVISPLEGSASIDDWTDKVITTQTEHFENLSVESLNFPSKEAKADIQDLLYSHPAISLIERHKDSFIISGSKEAVAEVLEETNEICLHYAVTTDELDLPKKYVKFLHEFHFEALKKEVNRNNVFDIQINPDIGSISITANPNGQREVKMKIAEFQSAAEEIIINISSSAHALLSSRRGTEKLTEILGVLHQQIVYDFEQTQIPDGVQYRICFLSKDKEVLKNVKENVEKYIFVTPLKTSVAKIRVCSSKGWRDLIDKLHEEHFVSVSVEEALQTIIVTGEQLACNDIVEKVKKFLAKHTNVEERITVSKSEWFVTNQNFRHKINAINDRAKLECVQIKWPEPNCKVSSLPIIISGEPDLVDNIKVMVGALLQSVYRKESRITNVPSIEHVLESMEDKLRLFETVDKVKVEITLENENNPEIEAIAGTESIFSQQVCAAVSPNGMHVSICTGDLTQNAPVGVIVNFILSNPNTQDGCLSHLLEFGGPEVMKDFKQKASDSMELKPGVKLVTCQGHLKCSQLIHYVLPSWKDSPESDETKEYFVETILTKVFRSTAHLGSVLITPLTFAPFYYPLNTFVKLVLDAVVSLSISMQVVVYVEEIGHANEFQSGFITRNFHVHQKVSLDLSLAATKGKSDLATTTASTLKAKTISNLNSFITLVNGSLLDQKVCA